MKMTQFANFANNATKQILGTSGLIRENLQSMFSYPDAINVLDPVTVSGNFIYIKDGAPLDAKRAFVYIEPLQAGSGTPSTDNIRPISGWTGANIIRCGKNIFDKNHSNILNAYLDSSRVTGSSASKTIYMRVKPNTRYMISKILSERFAIALSNYSIPTVGSNVTNFISDKTKTEIAITTKNDTRWLLIWLYSSTYDTLSFETILASVQVEETDGGATPYAQYIGDTYSITFPDEAGTVYGGTLDVTNGVLTVTYGNIDSYNSESLPGLWISSIDVYSVDNTPTIGAQVVYELATPQTYQLNPMDIPMLDGINNVYADCGSMELEYYRREGGGNPYV